MFGWANIRNQNLFVGVLVVEIFFFELIGILEFLKQKFYNGLKSVATILFIPPEFKIELTKFWFNKINQLC